MLLLILNICKHREIGFGFLLLRSFQAAVSTRVQQFCLTKFATFSINDFAEQMWAKAFKRLIFSERTKWKLTGLKMVPFLAKNIPWTFSIKKNFDL
jgi:hypothetical protein